MAFNVGFGLLAAIHSYAAVYQQYFFLRVDALRAGHIKSYWK